MKTWPAIAKQLLAMSILSVAAFFASGWASLYCYHFGSPFRVALDATLAVFQPDEPAAEPAKLGQFYASFLPQYWILSALAVVWFIGMGVYFWRTRRSLSGLALGLLPMAIFTSTSIGNLRMAWPACNAF